MNAETELKVIEFIEDLASNGPLRRMGSEKSLKVLAWIREIAGHLWKDLANGNQAQIDDVKRLKRKRESRKIALEHRRKARDHRHQALKNIACKTDVEQIEFEELEILACAPEVN